MITVPNSAELRRWARELGFEDIGVTKAELAPHIEQGLNEYLARNHHGDMEWMRARAVERAQPRQLWAEAKSAIVLTLSYAPAHDPLQGLEQKLHPNISVYAQGSDYHDIIKPRLKRFAQHLTPFGGDVKVFVDTAPLMEKPLAQDAGLGWQGKHTNLVSRTRGSWFFLGVVLTTLDLPLSAPEIDHCGTCQRCLEICPTNAFPAPYQLDARKCISYLTIEHKGPIPRDLRSAIGNRIYGCDDCLAVCPWNKFAVASHEVAFAARPAIQALSLQDCIALTDQEFRTLFSKSPIKRIGRNRFVRNAAIALGNAGDRAMIPPLQQLLNDEEAIVRGAAIWALSQLMTKSEFAALKSARLPQEKEETVRAEYAV